MINVATPPAKGWYMVYCNGKYVARVKDWKPIATEPAHWIGGEIGRCSACGHKGCASDIWDGIGEDEPMFCPACGRQLKGW